MQVNKISLRLVLVTGLIVFSDLVLPQTMPPQIHMVYMGGNDCPPCVYWRATELPKLQEKEAFKSIRFSYVQKSVRSPVPSLMFLPDEIKPYQSKLNEASAGRAGSPQVAILVNGEVYDYYFNSRSAEEVEKIIIAIKEGGKYPFKRCLKHDPATKQCAARA